MNRTYTSEDFIGVNYQELSKRIAYHEAGHATAIYLHNRLKKLPDIFFQICIENYYPNNKTLNALTPVVAAKIEGGYLTENPCLSLSLSQNEMNDEEKKEYLSALEADIINLLAGSITEAYFVSWQDGEHLNAQMLTLEVLTRYGSHSDFEKINEFLNILEINDLEKKQFLENLIHKAFAFITQTKTWRAIRKVAEFILSVNKNIISCEEIFTVIDGALLDYQNQF